MKTLGWAPILALLAGCAADRYAGLLPVAPHPSAPEVEERCPELRWEAFAPPIGGRVSDVVYDLRIHDAQGETVIYAADGLPGCAHRIERELMTSTAYRWTVRARFRLDGAPRLTAWTQRAAGHRDGAVSPASPVLGAPLRVR